MREVISVHVGQAGVQMGKLKLWFEFGEAFLCSFWAIYAIFRKNLQKL